MRKVRVTIEVEDGAGSVDESVSANARTDGAGWTVWQCIGEAFVVALCRFDEAHAREALDSMIEFANGFIEDAPPTS